MILGTGPHRKRNSHGLPSGHHRYPYRVWNFCPTRLNPKLKASSNYCLQHPIRDIFTPVNEVSFMSVETITKTMYRLTCDRPECSRHTNPWIAETIPSRCPKCKSRRWNRPRRIVRKKFLTFNGETLSLSEWANKLGVSKSVIPWRIKQGWTMDQVLSKDDWRFQQP